jgi:signal transduction histidine kinase
MKQIKKEAGAENLRQKAEDLLKKNETKSADLYHESDNLKLIHELHVHRIELELQNEELKQANDQAERISEKYTELYDSAPIGYFTLSKEGYITELNLVGALMLHKERSQLKNRIFSVFVSNDTKPVFKLFRETIFSSFALGSCEIILLTDGFLPLHVNLTGIVTKDGNNCLLTVADITIQKQAETNLILKNQELEKLNIQKDKFFSIVAHDLRGPFNGFLGLTQIIAKELPSLETSEIQAMGETMWRSATNIFKLLENLLQWSQMEQGLIPYKPGVFRLLSFAQESLKTEFQTADNKEIEVIFDIPLDIFVSADAKMLRSILSNLYSNATKFTPRGGKIIISARYSNIDKVEISIKDSGIGMSQEVQEKLFRLSEQINRKGTDGELSTGLGLFLCKEFIEKHNGTLRVESEEGKGSTFSFTVPCLP